MSLLKRASTIARCSSISPGRRLLITIEEHRAIVDALFNRDIELAVSLLEDHLKKDLEFSLYYLDFKQSE